MQILKIFEKKLRYKNYSQRTINMYKSCLFSFFKICHSTIHFSSNRFFDHVICEKEFKDFSELIEYVEKAYIDFRENNTDFIENKKILYKIRNKK